jgi:signal transduction histidine kinase
VQISDVWWVLIFSVLFGWVLAVIVGQFFLNPFIKLGLAMKRVAKGDFGIRLHSKSVFKLIKEVYGSFNLMTEELGMTEIVQTDFVSNVSHEFKTPINAIEGYATLLQGGVQSDAEREIYVEKILLNTGRLSELVSNILLISKIENQAIQTPNSSFRLDEQIRGAIVDLESKWGKKNIEFDVELDFVDYVGNQSLLRHVWDNLIDNAVKFSPEGSEIKIRLACGEREAVFSIADRGCGIDEKMKEHIFDKFFQGDSSHKGEGNGLGLSLVKKIVDIHGGDVSVENRSDGGCCFEISLPYKET